MDGISLGQMRLAKMLKTDSRELDLSATTERNTFLSTLPATVSDRTAALAIVGVASILFALAVPFAGIPLLPVPAFVASYQSALAAADIITAVLLLSQFAVLRTRALLVLATGYLFTAAAATCHALTFPGLFSPTGLLRADQQTAVWLYMIWHGGFPLCVLAYAWLKEADGGARISGSASKAICASALGVVAVSIVLTWIVTAQHDLLPVLLRDGRYTQLMIGVVSFVWSLSFAALVSLWFRRPHSIIDVWLMVVMCAWLFDIALSAIVNVARFDLGFYAGRFYGLCAATFVLGVLLIENVRLQAHTVGLVGRLRQQSALDRDYYGKRLALYGAVVESANDAIITKTLDGVITGWNKAAEHLFGYAATEAIGKPIDIIVPDDRKAEVRGILNRVGGNETIAQHETVRIRKDGRRLDVVLNIFPLKTAGGEIIGASKIAHDITEEKQSREKLRREIEERQRIFETSQDLILVTDGFWQFRPGQPEREGYPRIRSGGHGRTQRNRVHPSRRSRQDTKRDARGAARCRQAQLRGALLPLRRSRGHAELDGHLVRSGQAPFLHRPRPHREAGGRGAVQAHPEDGFHRSIDRRCRARLQQCADRHHRHDRHFGGCGR
ncbi:PAS domain S-box-containing protein [Bradyrhizobium sp. LM6.10]